MQKEKSFLIKWTTLPIFPKRDAREKMLGSRVTFNDTPCACLITLASCLVCVRFSLLCFLFSLFHHFGIPILGCTKRGSRTSY